MGKEAEALVESGQRRESWSNLHRCYRQAKVHPPPPTREELEQTSTLREDLYRWHPPEREANPILVQPERITDDTPEGEEIAVVVRIIQTGRAGGPSGMREYHLEV